MRLTFSALATVVAAALLVGAVGVGGVAADESNETNASDVVEEAADAIDARPSAEADTLANRESIRMDEDTEIVGWEFGDGNVEIAIATERTQRVTITDGAAGVGEAGATRIPQVDERIYGGETTIVAVPVEEAMGGHVVGVEVAGEGVRLSTDMDDSGDDPFRHFGGESGLFSGMLLALFSSMGGAGYVLYREDSGVRQA